MLPINAHTCSTRPHRSVTHTYHEACDPAEDVARVRAPDSEHDAIKGRKVANNCKQVKRIVCQELVWLKVSNVAVAFAATTSPVKDAAMISAAGDRRQRRNDLSGAALEVTAADQLWLGDVLPAPHEIACCMNSIVQPLFEGRCMFYRCKRTLPSI
jgi:hypothetical protein